jgi:hypothetical protein
MSAREYSAGFVLMFHCSSPLPMCRTFVSHSMSLQDAMMSARKESADVFLIFLCLKTTA